MFKKMKFIGEDGSMGLRYGKRYWARVFEDTRTHIMFVQYFENLLEINCCPYSSIEAIKKNWSL